MLGNEYRSTDGRAYDDDSKVRMSEARSSLQQGSEPPYDGLRQRSVPQKVLLPSLKEMPSLLLGFFVRIQIQELVPCLVTFSCHLLEVVVDSSR